MSRFATRRRMQGGQGHEHISELLIDDHVEKTLAWKAVRDLVALMKSSSSYRLFCTGSGPGTTVEVRVHPPIVSGGREFLQTVSDGVWSNNLLALPLG